ncbi:hypothetical protein DEJ50_11670 [Streptomyces venezuelae]|uniref:Muconolactone isomerase domain-containing protein n=1 Tax=Streptomyces venezuelae TaxID=54571 RepID=A0A5P2CZT3_STRVZ|nr:DUF3303 family protein [Streptomyces venezuelae]QES48385.1 hypothetical protein DEJ50_11670 [Streptomyces venezuelae]
MRVMIRFHVDTPAGNEAIRSGRLPQMMNELMGELKPEAAYFGLHEGVRSGFIVCDLTDSSAMPALLEPLFFELNAEIEVQPVMNAEDLKKGLAAMKTGPNG